MTKIQSMTMVGLGTIALVIGVLLASGTISSAQTGEPTATPSATAGATDDGSTPTPAPSDDSADDDDDSDTDGMRGCGGGKHLVKEAAAEVLGLSEDEVRQALQDGQTLAEIAVAQGMSAEEFKAALVANVTADLQARLDAGEITQDEFDNITTDLNEKVDDIINSEGGFRFHHRFDDADGDSNGTGTRFRDPFGADSLGSGA